MLLLLPHRKFHRITEIRPQLLIATGIKSVILDIDNTLTTRHTKCRDSMYHSVKQ
jgi:predicted HAD superfamily phosphohydrolase YqeG